MPTIISLSKKTKQNKTVLKITQSCKLKEKSGFTICCVKQTLVTGFVYAQDFTSLQVFLLQPNIISFFFRPSNSLLARDLGCFNFHSHKTSALNFRQVPVANGTAEICKISKKKWTTSRSMLKFLFFFPEVFVPFNFAPGTARSISR